MLMATDVSSGSAQPVPVVKLVMTMLWMWGMGNAVRAAVVLEGGDHPALGLDGGESGQACGLKELECLVVR